MTYKMTDEYRKILTEMIGECRHEDNSLGMPHSILIQYDNFEGRYQINEYKCHKCSKNFTLKDIRTYTTDSDMMKVFRTLKEELWVDWFNFKYFAKVKWEKDFWERKEELREPFEYWLMSDAERFCCLTAMAKKEGVI